jgi:hypothetical protein
MNDLDHMLNGHGSRQHHQEMIRQAQQEKFAHDMKQVEANHKVIVPVRLILAGIINLIAR